jgi:hypothetical protein
LGPVFIIDTRDIRNGGRRLKSQFRFHFNEEQATGAVRRVVELGCEGAAPTGECTCPSQTNCGGECTGSHRGGNELVISSATCGGECTAAHAQGCTCDKCKCCGHKGEVSENGCGEDCRVATMVIERAPHHDFLVDRDPLRLMQHIAGLMHDKAAAEAALEAKCEAHEEILELYEAMADLLADNAALGAKLQAQAEQNSLIEKLAALSAENARLKAHTELADLRIELAKNAAAVALENERLKLRVAELEQKQAAAEAARTAESTHSSSKSR